MKGEIIMPVYKQEDIAYVITAEGKTLCSKCYNANDANLSVVTNDEHEESEDIAVCDNCGQTI